MNNRPWPKEGPKAQRLAKQTDDILEASGNNFSPDYMLGQVALALSRQADELKEIRVLMNEWLRAWRMRPGV